MVAHATSDQSASPGLRPINSMRDVVGVTTLIERAFANDMDANGHKSMRELRWMSKLFGWADWYMSPGQGMLPGYVWVDHGHIVGNVTVRRLSMFGRGWMIGNVAVAPECRGRGIARQMMEASVDLVRHNGGDWIALQVRTDNDIAHNLYKSLGFVDTGEIVDFERRTPSVAGVARPQQPLEGHLRPARPGDMERLFTLAQSLVPDSVRWAEPIYRTTFDLSLERDFSDWFSSTQHVWRIVEVGDQIWGAAMLEAKHRQRTGRLYLWIVPAHTGRTEEILIDSVLAELNEPLDLVVSRIPGEHIAGRVALTTRSFRQVRAHTSMKLTLNGLS
jgi:ribosomal protein S18 acetylase RimI-like enzyme